MTFAAVLHLLLHIVVPGAVAWLAFRSQWRRAWGLMLLTLLVDVDHLLADPIYDPGRCSIGFHPLHTWPVMGLYAGLALWRPTRIVGVGLLIHMALDAADCAMM